MILNLERNKIMRKTLGIIIGIVIFVLILCGTFMNQSSIKKSDNDSSSNTIQDTEKRRNYI